MKTNQIYISVAAIFAAALIFMLPRYVVKSDKKQVSERTTTKAESKKNDEVHGVNFSDGDESTLKSLLANEQAQSSKNVQIWADSVILLLHKANLYDSAAAWSEGILNKFPDNLLLKEKVGDAFYQSGIFSTNREKAESLLDKARGHFEAILKKEPQNLDVKTKLGLTYLSSQPMKGIKLIRDEVLAANPDHLFALRSMGLLSMQTGQHDKAVQRFGRYLELKPDDAEVLLYWSVSNLELKRTDEAKKGFEKVLQISNDPALRTAAEDYLKSAAE
jgi:tetratricopeptide (TPR) repeat protein